MTTQPTEPHTENHRFAITVEIDRDTMWFHNRTAIDHASGVAIPEDPAEWDERDLLNALNTEVAIVTDVERR